jgi:hypothetical protein
MTSRDASTNVRLWVDVNPNIVFHFQHELINLSPYSPELENFMLNMGHHKVVACDATFVTNDKRYDE